MASLCQDCVKVSSLRKFIIKTGTVRAECEVCGARNTAAISCDDASFKAKVRSLIRYFYSETDYNPHLGGEHLETILTGENEITNHRDGWNENIYSDAIMELIDPPYEKYDEGISLFSGYTDGRQNRHLIALRRDSDERLRELKIAGFRQNHFLLDGKVKALLEPLVNRIAGELHADAALFRARIGYVASGLPMHGWFEERHYRPYEGSALGAPPPPRAAAGRMNRGGVSFLYLATTAATAVAEIRPHPGHFVSVGRFSAVRNLRVADVSSLEVTEFASSDRALDDYLLLKTVDDAFSIPVIPEERVQYHFTQLLADAFRHLGFDGAAYRSSVGSGKNYAFFDPESFSYDPHSASVVSIKNLKYETTTAKSMSEDRDYLTRPDGSFF